MAFYLFLHVSVIFSGNASVALPPFAASHGNMKLLPKVLGHVTDKKILQAILKDQDCIFRCVLKKGIFSTKCCSREKWAFRTWVLVVAQRRRCCWGSRAASLWAWRAGTTGPTPGGLLLSGGLGHRDLCQPRGTGLHVTGWPGLLRNYLFEKSWFCWNQIAQQTFNLISPEFSFERKLRRKCQNNPFQHCWGFIFHLKWFFTFVLYFSNTIDYILQHKIKH